MDAEDFSGINQATIKSAYGGFEQDNKAAKSIRRSYSERFPEKTERPPIIERSVRFDVNEVCFWYFMIKFEFWTILWFIFIFLIFLLVVLIIFYCSINLLYINFLIFKLIYIYFIGI